MKHSPAARAGVHPLRADVDNQPSAPSAAPAQSTAVVIRPGWSLNAVPGPDGHRLTPSDLPKGPTRWTARKKATLVIGVQNGLITMEDACLRYCLTPAEFFGWSQRYAECGLAGLKTTKRPRRGP